MEFAHTQLAESVLGLPETMRDIAIPFAQRRSSEAELWRLSWAGAGISLLLSVALTLGSTLGRTFGSALGITGRRALPLGDREAGPAS